MITTEVEVSGQTELALHFGDHNIRTVEKDGNVWLVAKDVCEALGLAWKGSRKEGPLGVIPEDWRGVSDLDTPQTNQHGTTFITKQSVVVINEQAVYMIAFRSNKPEARDFTERVAKFLRDFREGKIKVSKNDPMSKLLEEHTHRPIQIGYAKGVNAVLLRQKGVHGVREYNTQNCKIHTGLAPHEAKEIARQRGIPSKDRTSGKMAIRVMQPAVGCAMSMTDMAIAKNPNGNQEKIIRMVKEKITPAYEAMLELGFMPTTSAILAEG